MKLKKPKKILIDGASGFSLVELMVVVAIIGILASIAVPQFQSFAYKARLTEAKAGLTSIYTAEKAFFGEYMQYDPRFGVIGLQPEGQYFFNIGFNATGSNVATNYKGSVVVRASTTATYCGTPSYNETRCKNMTSAGVTAAQIQTVNDANKQATEAEATKKLQAEASGETYVAPGAKVTPDASVGLALDNESKVNNPTSGTGTPSFTAEAAADSSIHPRRDKSILKITHGRVITQTFGAL